MKYNRAALIKTLQTKLEELEETKRKEDEREAAAQARYEAAYQKWKELLPIKAENAIAEFLGMTDEEVMNIGGFHTACVAKFLPPTRNIQVYVNHTTTSISQIKRQIALLELIEGDVVDIKSNELYSLFQFI